MTTTRNDLFSCLDLRFWFLFTLFRPWFMTWQSLWFKPGQICARYVQGAQVRHTGNDVMEVATGVQVLDWQEIAGVIPLGNI